MKFVPSIKKVGKSNQFTVRYDRAMPPTIATLFTSKPEKSIVTLTNPKNEFLIGWRAPTQNKRDQAGIGIF
jgi:hypothetical protein